MQPNSGFSKLGRWLGVLLLSLVVMLCGPLHGVVSAQPVNLEEATTVAEQAEAFATALLRAPSEYQAEQILYQLFEFLGVAVVDRAGVPLFPGHEDIAEDDFYLYNFQVRLLAESFHKEEYVPLEDVIALWRDAGLVVMDPDIGSYVEINGVIVEKAMRETRRWAEDNPDEEQGFLIRLLDAMADRDDAPFDLLEEYVPYEETEDFQTPAMALREDIRSQVDEAMEGEEMPEEFDMERMLDAIMSGNIAEIMRAAVGDEGVEEMEEALRDMEPMDIDPTASPEEQRVIAMYQRSADLGRQLGLSLLEGETVDPLRLIEDLLEQQRATTESIEQGYRMHEQQWEDELREMNAKLRDGDPDAGAIAAAALTIAHDGPALMDHQWAAEEAADNLTFLEQAMEEAKEEMEREENSRIEFPYDEEDGPASTLVLDAIQAFLVQMDIILAEGEAEESGLGFGTVGAGVSWNFAQNSGQASPRQQLLGIIGDRLQAAVNTTSWNVLKEAGGEPIRQLKRYVDLPGEILDVLHGVAVMAAHTVEMEITYHPDNAELGEGIRLRTADQRSRADYENHYIQVKVTVTFDPPEAAQHVEWGRMKVAQFTRAAPPMTAPWLLGHYALDRLSKLEFPEAGPQENAVVQIRYADAMRRFVRLDPAEWYQPASGLVVTDENGTAVVKFRLIEESEPASIWGGRPEWAFGESGAWIRSHALSQMPEGGVWSRKDVILGVADWMQGVTGLGATDSRVHIERVKPVPWVGWVRYSRQIDVEVWAGAESPEEAGEVRIVTYDVLNHYTLKADSPTLMLEPDSHVADQVPWEGMDDRWYVELEGRHDYTEIRESIERCPTCSERAEQPVDCLVTLTRDYSGRRTVRTTDGTLQLSPRAAIQVRDGKYRVAVSVPVVVPGQFMTTVRSDVILENCDGSESDSEQESRMVSQHSVIQPEVMRYLAISWLDNPSIGRLNWPEYDRFTDRLQDSISWPSPVRNAPFFFLARPRIEVRNTLEWNFTRVLDPPEGD